MMCQECIAAAELAEAAHVSSATEEDTDSDGGGFSSKAARTTQSRSTGLACS